MNALKKNNYLRQKFSENHIRMHLYVHNGLVQMDISVGRISHTEHARSVSRFLSVRNDRGRESTEKLLIRFDASLWSQEGGGKDLHCCDIPP